MRNSDVFVNCPYDDEYKSSFEALIFTIVACGYRPRCALEESDAGDIRFDKLCRLIAACDQSVHDLSRIEMSPSGLPRFNMPFELGLTMGAKRFGSKVQRTKSAAIMVRERFKLPAYLSDLAGNDPEPHHGQPEGVIKIVRRYLHSQPDGRPVAGATRLNEEFGHFKLRLPGLATKRHLTLAEVDPFKEYRNFLHVLIDDLKFA